MANQIKTISLRDMLGDYPTLVGTLVFLHQELSRGLDQLVFPLVRCNQAHAEIMASAVKEFEAKVDLVSQLVHARFIDKKSHRDASMRKEMNRLHGKLDHVNGVRNDVIHGHWIGHDENVLTVVRIKPKTVSYEWKLKPHTKKDLEDTGKDMFDLMSELHKFAARIYAINDEERKVREASRIAT